ncbi:BamA/TamA family outer membrane protein [candidate division KSB1 bacterium]
MGIKNNKFSTFSLLILCSIVFTVSPIFVYADDKKQENDEKTSGFLVLPVLGSSPETNFMFGGAVQYFFRESGSGIETRPSTLTAVFIYTQNKQIISLLEFDLYRRNEEFQITGGINYTKFPDKFYGIGNNTVEENEESYTPELTGFELNVRKRIYPGLYIGASYRLFNNSIIKTEEDGILRNGSIPGSGTGKVSGIGFSANYDTRDNIFSPSNGKYYSASVNIYDKVFGGDYDFHDYVVNIRQYFPIFENQVFAVQGYMKSVHGTPPFQMLSLFGGDSIMRGYYQGRFRDRNMIACQLEYRSSDWKSIGMIAFAGIGDVADKFSNFKIDNFKHTLGFGFRYLVSKNEKVKIRMDFGFGKETSGMYLSLNEAF